MILLLLSGLCLFLSLGIGSVIFIVVPVLLFKFPAAIVTAVEFIVSLGQFYWEILMFLFNVFLDVSQVVFHVCSTFLPVIYHLGTQLFQNIADYWQIFRYQHVPQLWNFAQQQRELFLLFWGVVVTFSYAFWNSLRTQLFEERIPWQDRRDFDEDYDDFNDDGENAFNDNIRNARQAGHENFRQRNTRQRLYPNLDEQDTYMDNAGRYEEERACVVCFESRRNAAVFPCGHTQLCLACTRTIMGRNRRCPICQGQIREYRQVYV